MAIRKCTDERLKRIGRLITEKRLALGKGYSTREKFISRQSETLFDDEEWISIRHLVNIENGNNWLSIEMMIKLAYALEIDPLQLFSEIHSIITNDE